MSRVVSIHNYQLKKDVEMETFSQAIGEAHDHHLFDLPGLESFRFLHGIKGENQGLWTAIWVYSSRKAWEKIWGGPTAPKSREEYPDRWRRWEDEYLAPLLSEDPDRIDFTAYDEIYSTFP